jgi:hypothetical protein
MNEEEHPWHCSSHDSLGCTCGKSGNSIAEIEQLLEILLTVDGKGREAKREALIKLISNENEINIIKQWRKI